MPLCPDDVTLPFQDETQLERGYYCKESAKVECSWTLVTLGGCQLLFEVSKRMVGDDVMEKWKRKLQMGSRLVIIQLK